MRNMNFKTASKPEKAKQGYQKVFMEGFVSDYALEIRHRNGCITPVLYNATVYKNESGGVIGIFAAARDITERKKAEEALAKIEIVRKQEIHHIIKNNLQVISSMLDLQAETFRDQECIKDSEVLKAFRESQNRVISMALIHEELYKGRGFKGEGFDGEGFETLNFSQYIEKLAANLFLTNRLENTDVSLNMDLEENLFFDMDTAVPLGMIVNELVSNSLKHAFPGRDKGETRIKLSREDREESALFTLTISDNGVGIPENLDIEDLDSLGLQLVTSLVDQLDGKLELKRDNGTEFIIRFAVIEKSNPASVPAPQLI
jgi:two-component sensor histidine kinase